MRTTRALLLPLAGATLAGCWGPSSSHRHTYYGSYSYTPVERSYYTSAGTQPTLELNEQEVGEAFAALARRREAKAQTAPVSAPYPGDVWSSREAIEESWRQARREQAEALVQSDRQVLELDEARESGAVMVLCHYQQHGRGGSLELTLQRGNAQGDVALAIHPGTFGEPVLAGATERHNQWVGDVIVESGESGEEGRPWTHPRQDQRYRHWPSPQDLALLSAQVVVLPAGQQSVSAYFPVSCASFEKQGPQSGQAYELRRFPADSAADRFLVALCANEVKGSEAEVQLATWLARNDISWGQFTQQGGHYGRLVTFGRNDAVLPEHARGAARMLLDSGVDPRASRFFGGEGIKAESLAPLTPAPEAPPEPEQPKPEQVAEKADTLEG